MNIYGYAAMLLIMLVLAWPLRGTALWPIAIPVALAFGEAGFVQTWDLLIEVPGLPVPLRWLDIVFFALVIAWLLVRRLSAPETDVPSIARLDVLPLAAWLLMVALAVPLAWVDGGAVKLGVAWAVLPYCYVPLSAWLFYDILARTRRAEMWTLFRSLAVVVSVLSVFYALHMIGLSLYDLAGVNSTYAYSTGIRRDSLTFPIWACITVPVLLWRERIRMIDGCMIIAQVAAVAISLTRSLVLSCLAAVVLVIIMRLIMRRRPFQPLVPVGIGAAAVAALMVAVPGFVERTAGLVFSRFDELSAGIASVTDVAVRLDVGGRVSNFLSGWGLWMGAGFSDAATTQSQANVGHLLVSDSLWALVLLHFGVIGVVLVALSLIAGVIAGLYALRRWRAEPLSLGVVATAAVLWLIARTPASSEILTYYPVVCGFVLALIVVEARGVWSTSGEVRGLLFNRGDARPLPTWLPRTVVVPALVVLAVVLEVVVGRALAK